MLMMSVCNLLRGSLVLEIRWIAILHVVINIKFRFNMTSEHYGAANREVTQINGTTVHQSFAQNVALFSAGDKYLVLEGNLFPTESIRRKNHNDKRE